MKKRILLLLLPLILTFALAIPVLAEGLYRAEIVIEDTSDVDREYLGVLVPFNTQTAIDMDYLGADGLDSRFLEGTTERYFMVADDKLGLLIPELLASQEREYRFETGWTPEITNFGVIPGAGGSLTVPSAPFTDLGPGFDLVFEGFVDTTTVTPDEDAYPGPTVEGSATSSENSITPTHTVSLPSSIAEDDLLLMVIGFYTTDSSPVITWPSNWVELDQDWTGNDACYGIAYKIATGSEGSTVDVTTDFSATSAHNTLLIDNYEGLPEVSTIVEGTTDPNPGSLTTSWGTAGETLWIACFGAGSLGAESMNAYPSGFTGGIYKESTAGYSSVGSARKLESTATQNPGIFDASPGHEYGAWTIGIKGFSIKSLVGRSGDYTVDVTAANELTFDSDGYFNYEVQDGAYAFRPSSSITACGQRCDDFTGDITEVQIYMRKIGIPAGTLYVRARSVSGDTLLGTFGSMLANDLTVSAAWYTFTTDVDVTTLQDVRVTVEYDAGTDTNYIQVYRDSAGVPGGVGYSSYGDVGSWVDSAGSSLYFRMQLEEDIVITGIASGSRDFRVWDDSGTLKFDVDSVTEGSITLPWQGDDSTPAASKELEVQLPYVAAFSLDGYAAFATSYDDPGSKWTDEEYAYDGLESTFANPSATTDYLELTPDSPISCDHVVLYAYADSPTDSIYVDVYYSGTWNNIYSGYVNSNGWRVYEIGSTETVSEARVKYFWSDSRLYEFYFGLASADTVVAYELDYTIQGSTLDNESYAPYDGVITWGPNFDLTVTVGGLQSITSYTSEAGGNATIPSVAPDLPDLDLFPADEAVTGLPWYSLVNPAAIGLEWSTNTLYSILYIFIAIGVGVGVMIATGSALLGAIATGAGLAVAAGTGVTGWWILLVYAIFAAGYLVVVRSV